LLIFGIFSLSVRFPFNVSQIESELGLLFVEVSELERMLAFGKGVELRMLWLESLMEFIELVEWVFEMFWFEFGFDDEFVFVLILLMEFIVLLNQIFMS